MLSRVNVWIDAMFLFNNQIFFLNLEVKMTDVRCTCSLKSLCMSPGFRDKYYKVISISNISISNISTAFSNSITNRTMCDVRNIGHSREPRGATLLTFVCEEVKVCIYHISTIESSTVHFL